ncbi:hypothetical protein E1B28_006960 [Marasmius oreades]|uniref:Uncharacterized protein n=1 Tax=Marasmius oreades TaxID=181124 RepID=A0A9P7S1A3_9AGAR|nr:uncharacterized protein E1B28_006960 [Marasmius oreades]KAG7093277.1 hypothetical protein E1B28_006960 [Marasmius oreades]
MRRAEGKLQGMGYSIDYADDVNNVNGINHNNAGVVEGDLDDDDSDYGTPKSSPSSSPTSNKRNRSPPHKLGLSDLPAHPTMMTTNTSSQHLPTTHMQEATVHYPAGNTSEHPTTSHLSFLPPPKSPPKNLMKALSPMLANFHDWQQRIP